MRVLLHIPGHAPLDLHVAAGQTLAQGIWLSGMLAPPPLCSGLGQCGRCRVRFLDAAPPALPVEAQLFPAEALEQGWRLACRRMVEDLGPEAQLELPEQDALPQASPRSCPAASAAAAGQELLLAVDLGTTSLQWRACTLDGNSVAQGQELNPQMGAGSEVMSRLAVAQRPGGLERLSRLTQEALRRIVASLPAPASAMCVAGNTAMTAILLQKDISSLAAAPYRVPFAGHSLVRLAHLPPMYIPPQPAPFVGGDLSAGIAALLRDKDIPYPFLLADMGTNGEFVLGLNPQEYLLASVPLGPALEGIGLRFGQTAGPGAVTAFSLTPAGLQAVTWDQSAPRSICGTGYLSLIHVLLRADVLGQDGVFRAAPATPLGRKIAARLDKTTEPRLPLPGGMYLAAGDVEEILKVKAAFSLALEQLLAAGGLSPSAVRAVYLAGALGSHVSTADMETLGFVPQGMGMRLHAVGNTALDGAQQLLLHTSEREQLARWSQRCRVLDLVSSPDFTQHYLRHMRFC